MNLTRHLTPWRVLHCIALMLAVAILVMCASVGHAGDATPTNTVILETGGAAAAAAAAPIAATGNWLGAAIVAGGMLLQTVAHVFANQSRNKWHNATIANILDRVSGGGKS